MNDDDNQRNPRPLTARKSIFCEKVAEGATLTDAYSVSHDVSKMKKNTISARASELAKVPAIADRIAYLQGVATAAAVERISYSIEDAMRQADDAYDFAKENGQAGAAVSAATLKAKLAGLLIERRDVRSAGPLDDADIAVLLRMRRDLEESMAREAVAEDPTGASPKPAERREGNRPTSRALQ